MKKFIFLGITSLIFCQNVVAHEQLSLSISFVKFKQVAGTLHYQLLDCSDTSLPWSELPVLLTQQLAVTKQVHQQTLNDLDTGRYCLRFFQDLNKNNELDLAASAIPKEPVGFSNNPNLMLGQPTPGDSVFELTKNMDLTIKVNNKKRR